MSAAKDSKFEGRRESDPVVTSDAAGEATLGAGPPLGASAANPQEPGVPVEVYVEHALIGAAYSAHMYGANPKLSDDAKVAYRWAEREFNRIAKKEVGEHDLIG